MRENNITYQVETSEINQEKMQFTVVNHKPLKTEVNIQENIEQELYKIFHKYA